MSPSSRPLVLPQRPAPSGSSADQTGYGLSRRLTRAARDRLGGMGLALAGAAGMGVIGAPSLPRVMGADPGLALYVGVFNTVGVLLNLGLWRLARSDRFEDRAVLDFGLMWQVVGCFAINLHVLWFFTSVKGFVPPATPALLWILLQPVLVSSPVRRTATTALLAAATTPLALGMLMVWAGAEATIPELVDSLTMPLVAAGLAIYASRVVHGLARDVATAERLGSYQLEERLGEGGMGEVWRATHGLLARPAAVKLIRPEMLGPDDSQGALNALVRFEQEARTTAALRSPHTVEVFDFGQTADGRLYYVMELLDGIDLAALVATYGAQPAARVVSLIQQACHSLDEAHAVGLVHRDIKPANLFVCRYGRDHDFVKVLDFGLVRVGASTGADSGLTQAHATLGTPAFMPPEAANGGTVDGRSDLYSLACVAYLLLTGDLVFEAATPLSAVVSHVHDTPVPPSQRSPLPIPPELDAILMQCLSKAPEDRIPTAQELSRRLAAVPLEAPWTEEDAERWWQAHQAAQPDATALTASQDQLAPTMPVPGLATP